jgi:D-alanyl-lipoteichoic acid acyltransferase DltB (MBOAT superfamily)
MKDFWKRWHISLSSWIRDYLYLPLTGTKVLVSTGKGGIGQSLDNQPSAKRKNVALFATWAIMGFWHGSNWTFILWGLYHAVFIFLERKLAPLRKRIPFLSRPIVTWPLTLGIAMVSWIPFRAQSLTDALVMYSKILNPSELLGMNLRENSYLVAALMLVVFVATWAAQRFLKPIIERSKAFQGPVLIVQYTIALLFVFVFLRPINQFIYFQF